MTTETDIIARTKELLSEKPSFMAESDQLMVEMSTVMGVGVNMVVTESHNDRNEFYTETAQLDSSKLAKASDEGRVPNRPLPQIVKCEITSDEYVEFNGDSVAISDIATKYIFDGVIVVDGDTVQATLRQEEKKSYFYTPTSQDWQEFIVGGKKTSRFFVYVGGKLWEDSEAIGDLEAGAEGYVTRYNTLDQLYIRMGNPFLGKIPDGQIEIVSYDTESQDIQVDAPLYVEGIEQTVEIKVIEILQSSQPQESADSTAKSLPMWRLKAGGSGYNSDYIDDIRNEFPESLSVRAWGEKKESAIYDRDNINIIFISALRQNSQETFGVEVIEFLKSKKHIMQVEFEWKEPISIASSITITGKTERTKTISTSKTALTTEIAKYYGLYADKAYRKNRIYKSFLNQIIDSTKVFENLLPNKSRDEDPEYEVDITGSQIPSGQREIIHIPNENITFAITKVDNTK